MRIGFDVEVIVRLWIFIGLLITAAYSLKYKFYYFLGIF
jgi:hypothetical protein